MIPENFTTAILDAGYDYEPIYRQALNQTMKAVIPYNVRREGEMIGFYRHFRPTCVRKHSYRYDSFDEKNQTLKFTRPKECTTCPLCEDSLCQKVLKSSVKRYS